MKQSTKRIIDSSCLGHMCNPRASFGSIAYLNKVIRVGIKDTVESWRVKNVMLVTIVNDIGKEVVLPNVLYSSKLTHNLLSVSYSRKYGFEVRIDTDHPSPEQRNMKMQHLKSEDSKVVRIKTKYGIYEPTMSTYIMMR